MLAPRLQRVFVTARVSSGKVFLCPEKNYEGIPGTIGEGRQMKLGAILVIAGILVLLFSPPAGVVLIIIGAGLFLLSSAPADYNDEEQLDTEDEINFIYFDD